MSHAPQPDRLERIGHEYANALRAYVFDGGEAALTRAYELGRRAAAEGVGVLELARLHHEALATLPANSADELKLKPAAEFFAESLSPFEMTLRAYQANARLLGLNETLAKQNEEIDRARDQLRAILDATSAMIYLKDAQERYLFVNRQFQEVFDRPRDEVIGKTDGEIFPAEMAGELSVIDREVLANGEARELEVTVSQADGPHTYLSLKFPLLDPARIPYAICCVATDITERKRAATALHRAKEAAEAANRELESFSYSVAHDLRAPLRSLDGFSQALIEDWADRLDDKGRRYLEFVRESAQQMGHLIDDLLSVSRVARGEMTRRRVDVSDVARRIGERLQESDAKRAVELVVTPNAFANADPRLVRAVLENLIGNAWKFTSKCAFPRIEFGQQPGGPVTIYFVRDNGAGFDMAYSEKLFGVFQRLHSKEEFEGSGIGLATVKRIVGRHGGRVWAESEVGRGATFYFTLEEESAI
jgi:hypothetical protein